MNETFGDLMAQYVGERDAARRFDNWGNLDKFVEGLIQKITIVNAVERLKVSDFTSPVIIVTEEKQHMRKFQEYAYDDMGTAIHMEDTNGD